MRTIKFGVVFSVWLVMGSAWAGNRVYVYQFKFKASSIRNLSSDFGSQHFAKFIVADEKLNRECVDLRRIKRSSISGENGSVVDDTIGLVLNGPIDSQNLSHLESRVCKSPIIPLDSCSIKVSKIESYSLADLSIRAYTDRNGEVQSPNSKRPQVAQALGSVERLPNFSRACRTGNHDDSWNHSADTEQSRLLMRDLQIDMHEVRDFDLEDKSGKKVWAFGFPDHSLDDKILPVRPKMENPKGGTGEAETSK